jgi:two-component system chemotaxis response regulator CheB
MGASAGGVEALSVVVGGLPAEVPTAIGVVLHVTPTAESHLPRILGRAGALPVTHAVDGEPARPGRVYVAPPDRHLLLRDGRWRVVRGPTENHTRPAIDPLFRSAAAACGRGVVAVVLSGTRSDGVAGAAAVSRRGGAVIVQDPDEARFPDMPSHTIAQDHPDYVLPAAEIAPRVVELVEKLTQEAIVSDNGDDQMSVETSYAALDREAIERLAPPGAPSPYSCPACGGVLFELEEGDGIRFRCRVGHGYTVESAFEDQSGAVDAALWAALRALHERAALSQRMAERVRARGSGATAERFERHAREAIEQAELIRTVLLERDVPDG